MLDVFRTLVKHLRISIQGPLGIQDESELLSEDSLKFQRSITKTVGDFAGVLPDYHKPDIMNLINSYMVINTDSSTPSVGSMETVADQGFVHNYFLCLSVGSIGLFLQIPIGSFFGSVLKSCGQYLPPSHSRNDLSRQFIYVTCSTLRYQKSKFDAYYAEQVCIVILVTL